MAKTLEVNVRIIALINQSINCLLIIVRTEILTAKS